MLKYKHTLVPMVKHTESLIKEAYGELHLGLENGNHLKINIRLLEEKCFSFPSIFLYFTIFVSITHTYITLFFAVIFILILRMDHLCSCETILASAFVKDVHKDQICLLFFYLYLFIESHISLLHHFNFNLVTFLIT